MDLYTLSDDFLEVDVVDEFDSLIWTERYSTAGDVSLTVTPTPEKILQLKEKTFLKLRDSDEVMQIDTALIEEGRLKVTGKTLDYILNERYFRIGLVHETRESLLGSAAGPGNIMSQIVQLMCMSDSPYATDAYSDDWFDISHQVIDNLTLVSIVDETGVYDAALQIAIPYDTPIYEILTRIAEQYNLGFRLFLWAADSGGYTLAFTVYKGRDLTSTRSSAEQAANPTVRFSPALNSLTDLKELRSIAGYKNVAYAFGPGVGTPSPAPGVAFADADADASRNFDRRVLMVMVDGIAEGDPDATAKLTQKAKDALANNNYTKIVDGEIVPQNDFVFGANYKLGDIVELEGTSGIRTKARVTEYIRTQDATGERGYPTVSVID